MPKLSDSASSRSHRAHANSNAGAKGFPGHLPPGGEFRPLPSCGSATSSWDFIAANSRRKSWKVMHQILSALGRKWHISLSLTALLPEEVTWPYLIRRELGNLGHQKTSQWGARVSAIDVKWEDWIIQESRGILHRQGTFMLGFEDSLGAGLVMNTEEGLRRLREHHMWGHRSMKELEMSEMPEEE